MALGLSRVENGGFKSVEIFELTIACIGLISD